MPQTRSQSGQKGHQRGGRERTGRSRYIPRRKVCGFCVEHVKAIDYKDVPKLRRFLSDRAKIEGRRRTGTCAKHQRMLARALKRARFLALLPYTPGHVKEVQGAPAPMAAPVAPPVQTAPAAPAAPVAQAAPVAKAPAPS